MQIKVDIPRSKLRLLQQKADARGLTVNELILHGLDSVLLEKEHTPFRRRLELPLIDSQNPGSLKIDNEDIYARIGFP